MGDTYHLYLTGKPWARRRNRILYILGPSMSHTCIHRIMHVFSYTMSV